MKTRIVPAAMLLGVVGLGIAVLTAAKEAGGDPGEPSPKANDVIGKKLVCIGYADTDERIVQLFPKNFPQPSMVTKVKVKEGDHVEADQELLEFDDKPYQLKIKQAEIAIQLAKARQAEAEAGVKAHEAQVNVMYKELLAANEALKNKQAELAETKRLNLSASPQQLAANEAAVREAELKHDGARIKYDSLRTMPPTELVETAKVGVLTAENMKHQAEDALRLLCCKAPAKGLIIRSFVSDGASFSQASREPAFWFLKDGDILIRAEVTQEFARRVIIGQAAKVEDEADAQQTWKGKVSKVGLQFLAKRTSHSPADFLQMNDERVLECLIALEKSKDVKPPRYGQKVRITLSD